jgi:hypothetical protein
MCRAYSNYARALIAEHTGKGPTVKSRPEIPLNVKGEIATAVHQVLEAWDNKGEQHCGLTQIIFGDDLEQFF